MFTRIGFELKEKIKKNIIKNIEKYRVSYYVYFKIDEEENIYFKIENFDYLLEDYKLFYVFEKENFMQFLYKNGKIIYESLDLISEGMANEALMFLFSIEDEGE